LPAIDLADGARCTVLGPTLARLDTLERAWAADKRGSTDDPIAELAQRLGSDLDRGGSRSFGGDGSVANGSSIALLFEYGSTSLLLTGDAYAGDLESSIRRLLDERGLPQLDVDLFKARPPREHEQRDGRTAPADRSGDDPRLHRRHSLWAPRSRNDRSPQAALRDHNRSSSPTTRQ